MSDISKPLITTIIPTYRRPKLLQRAINSVLNQTYPHFQVCVYDNASGDETARVVAELAKEDPRVKYHYHSENIGALKNFNYGMTHVNTPFFSFLSDDDMVLPTFFETALNAFEQYPDAIFVATRVIGMDLLGRAYPMCEISSNPGYYEPPEGFQKMLLCGHPTWTGILFKREINEKMGGLDEKIGAPADLEFVLRAAAHFSFVSVNKVCAIFVSHEDSLTASAKFDYIWPCWGKMIDKFKFDSSLSVSMNTFATKYLSKQIKKKLIIYVISAIIRNNFDDAYKSIKILRVCFKLKVVPFVMILITSGAKKFPAVRNVLFFLNEIRKSYRRSNPGISKEQLKTISAYYLYGKN